MYVCVCSLTQQEQALAQSQGGWLSPGGGRGSEAKTVDIIQMLTKARTEYDKVGKHQRLGRLFWGGDVTIRTLQISILVSMKLFCFGKICIFYLIVCISSY